MRIICKFQGKKEMTPPQNKIMAINFVPNQLVVFFIKKKRFRFLQFKEAKLWWFINISQAPGIEWTTAKQ